MSDCVFDLENETLWKSMSQMKLSLVRKLDPVTFIPPRVNSSQLERDTETALKKAIGDLRKDLGLNTSWDDNLGYVLSTALQAYEVSHISNTASNTLMDDFNEIIKNIIPPKREVIMRVQTP